jgi:hypothetical protein
MAETWALKSSSDVLLEEIDEFLACYSVETGRTHILDAFPGEIVKLLSCTPQTSSEIGAAFAIGIGEGTASEWVPKIHAVLLELLDLQLVQTGLS